MPRLRHSWSYLGATLFLCFLLADCVKGQCQVPPSKTGLELTEESAALDTFDEGSSVTFKCGAGYTKVSGDGTIFCRNGIWTVETLQCQKKSCGSPGDLINGRFSTPEGTDFGATAYASCNRGYEMHGTAYRQCYDFGWNNRVPRCEIRKCADPPTIVNGRISSSPDKEFPEFRDIVQYTCDKNYKLVGDSQLVCNEFGSYNGTVPQCKGQCQVPPSKTGLELTEESAALNTFDEGSSVTFKCGAGYTKVSGDGTIFCRNGIWTVETLQCQKKSCGSPGDLINGRFSTPEGTDFGATAYAYCNRGYEVQGKPYRQCSDLGWTNHVPRCEIKKCDDPPTIVNGIISSRPDTEFPVFRDIVQYKCDKNYNIVGDSQLVCNEFGSYNGTVPQCKELNCPTPSIKNAQRVEGGPPPYKLKYFVTYRCNDGYVMEGQSKLVCEATGWSSDFPTCNKDPKPVVIAVFATLGALAVVGIIAAFLFKSYKKKREYLTGEDTRKPEGEMPLSPKAHTQSYP
ncbi:complement receptor type 1-like isoform X3 [Anguilla rostrata]|uniref:complement receptor type 1-like isoform X3 n=1 Tax=Anguilla rostrata TaxID=7938 RepID=UPI0030CEC2C6